MDVLIYILVVCLIIYLVLTLLPIILPIVLILLLVLFLVGWYTKHKIKKHIEETEEMWTQEDDDFFRNDSSNTSDVIDVEYTERDDD